LRYLTEFGETVLAILTVFMVIVLVIANIILWGVIAP
jgi:hypothetical protein